MISEVKLRQDWGYNIIRPLAGTLQDDFHETRLMHIPLDEKRNVARLPWGLELPLAPFFGIMGAAPPKRWGRITSIVPCAHGGNLDNKELAAGARLFPFLSKVGSSPAVTVMAPRAMAKSASPRSRRPCRGLSNSSSATILP